MVELPSVLFAKILHCRFHAKYKCHIGTVGPNRRHQRLFRGCLGSVYKIGTDLQLRLRTGRIGAKGSSWAVSEVSRAVFSKACLWGIVAYSFIGRPGFSADEGINWGSYLR